MTEATKPLRTVTAPKKPQKASESFAAIAYNLCDLDDVFGRDAFRDLLIKAVPDGELSGGRVTYWLTILRKEKLIAKIGHNRYQLDRFEAAARGLHRTSDQLARDAQAHLKVARASLQEATVVISELVRRSN